MLQTEPNEQRDFMIEKIKERPINKTKLVRSTLLTVSMAVIFGLVASFTFLVLEPVISRWMYPEEPMPQVQFPEDYEEMSPEDMLADNLSSEKTEIGDRNISDTSTQPAFSEVSLTMNNYREIYYLLSEYTQNLKHTMVTVTGSKSNVDWLNNIQESQTQTYGVFIAGNAKEYYILTEYEPLKDTEKITITLSYNNRYFAEAELKAYDSITNLAVVCVKREDLPQEVLKEDGIEIAKMGSSNMRNLEGTPVVALGRPMGVIDSVGYGMITASGGEHTAVDSNYKVLQTDISGSQEAAGVLFNLQNEVIGIITENGRNALQGNFVSAYGITDLKTRMEKMSNAEPLSYLGIIGSNVTATANEQLQIPYGAYVQKVDMDSPAMRAGIQQGDVITVIDGRSISSYSEYTNVLMQIKSGDTVLLTVNRQTQNDYKEMQIEITTGVVK